MALKVIPARLIDDIQRGAVPQGVTRFTNTLAGFPVGQLVTFWSPMTVYNFNPTPGTVSIVSTSTQDSAAGTGVRTISLAGLDPITSLPKEENTTLNGTTPVVSTLNYRTITQVTTSARTVGSLGGAAGTISFTIGGVLQAILGPGEVNTTAFVETFPPGTSGYIQQLTIATTGIVDVIIKIREFGTDTPFRTVHQALLHVGGPYIKDFLSVAPIRQPGLSDSMVMVRAYQPDVIVGIGVENLVIDDNLLQQ